MTLGERVATLRKARGWNQKELAEAAGVHPSVVSLIERDNRPNARPETIMKLAHALGVTAGHLFGEEPQIVNSTSDTLLEQYRKPIELARSLQISPAALTELIQTAASMFKK